DHIVGRGVQIIEENLAVSRHRRGTRDTSLVQARQTLVQAQNGKALGQGVGQRRLDRMALLWRIGVGAACGLAVKGLAERQALFRGLCHHIDPAVVPLVQSVVSVKAILALIRQASRWLALVPGEPRRAEHNTAAEQVTIDTLHYTRTLSDEQGENRP